MHSYRLIPTWRARKYITAASMLYTLFCWVSECHMRNMWKKPSHMYVERVWIIKSRIEKYVHNIIRLKFSDCKYFSCWSGKTLDVDTFFVYFVFVGHKIIRLFLRVLSQKQDGIVLWYINSKLFLYGCKQKICFYLLAQKVVSNKLTSIWWIP